MIELSHVTKRFGARRAVDDVSFSVQRGEIIGLLGPNGSGKTTLMRVLTGFFPPTSGRASVAGFDATNDALALRRCIGYLPESVVPYPDMGVRQFLAFCAGLRRVHGSEVRRRVATVLQTCGLAEVAERRIGNLSKGYRQRIGLAQALLHEPQVLILDEPTVGLDPRQVMEMRRLVNGLRGRATVLLSTHVLSEASVLCDRVVIIDRGRIIAEDSAAALARRVAGAERTLVRVEGPGAEVRSALAAVEGVEQVEEMSTYTGLVARGSWLELAHREAQAPSPEPRAPSPEPRATSNEPRATSFVIRHQADDAVRPRLAAVVVSHGWRLCELRPMPLSMEEMFLRLVGDETEQVA